jgi:hypothetical protein
MPEKDDKYKLDGVDEYGRPKYKISNFDAYMKDARSGVSNGYLVPLDFPFSIWGERKIKNAPPTKKEMISINKRKADLKANLARLKAEKKMNAELNAKDKPKPSAPKPTQPNIKGKPTPSGPDSKPTPKPTPESKPNYKNAPMPNKSGSKKKYYGKA